MEPVQEWIETHLRLQVNAKKSGVGRTWEPEVSGIPRREGAQVAQPRFAGTRWRKAFGGAWHLAGTGSLQTALSNATLRRYGFLMPSDLAGD